MRLNPPPPDGGGGPRAAPAGPLLLVDSASIYFRAYFGVPPTAARAADGTPTNAVRGFLDAMANLIRTRRPGRIVCALDAAWRPRWRVALVSSYKAHRVGANGAEETPAALADQIPIILESLAALGLATVGVADFEADDVIATLATTQPGPVEIATGDRDLFQLVDDDRGVAVLYCGGGVARLVVVDDAAVRARFGVPAARYVDLATLRGDPSDGLPGVRGVGEKTAARLIERHGDLEAILAATGDPDSGLTGALAARIAAAADQIAAAHAVTLTRRDVPMPAVDTTPQAADEAAVAALSERYGLGGPLRRVRAALDQSDRLRGRRVQ